MGLALPQFFTLQERAQVRTHSISFFSCSAFVDGLFISLARPEYERSVCLTISGLPK